MTTFICEKCTKIFDKKSALSAHQRRKTPCILIEEEDVEENVVIGETPLVAYEKAETYLKNYLKASVHSLAIRRKRQFIPIGILEQNKTPLF